MIPVSLSLKGKHILIVGGGQVALRKARLFMSEKAMITIVAPVFDHNLLQLPLHFIKREYQAADILETFLVYAATDSKSVNQQIVLDCQKKHILCGSATYHQDASFYSVSYYEHKIATLSLSMHQKLPYHQPLLKQLKEILDKNEKKIEKIELLRPYIIKYIDEKTAYFERLFHCDDHVLDFLYQSLIYKKGTFFVYHQSLYQEHYHFSIKPSLVLSIKQLQHNLDLFVFPIQYELYPLVLFDGFVYQKIVSMVPCHWKIFLPLIQNQYDVAHILSLYKRKNKYLICLIHSRQKQQLYDMIKKELKDEGEVHDLDENLKLNRYQDYQILMMLMTHGIHYRHMMKTIETFQQEGYHIDNLGALIDQQEIIDFIQNR